MIDQSVTYIHMLDWWVHYVHWQLNKKFQQTTWSSALPNILIEQKYQLWGNTHNNRSHALSFRNALPMTISCLSYYSSEDKSWTSCYSDPWVSKYIIMWLQMQQLKCVDETLFISLGHFQSWSNKSWHDVRRSISDISLHRSYLFPVPWQLSKKS